MTTRREFCGELLGTFLLVFFGLSAVVAAVILDAHVGLFQVAAIWGLGLMVAISVSAGSSGAHLNPAITLAFAMWSDFSWRKVVGYVLAQCAGAFLAALLVFVLFQGALENFDREVAFDRLGEAGEMGGWSEFKEESTAKGIHVVQGDEGKIKTIKTAMVFGEYYPNPAAAEGGKLAWVGMREAFLAETIGTALLALTIFTLVGQKRESVPVWLVPILLGVVLVVLISLLAPITQGGFNPARDLMPRLVSSMLGWGSMPLR